MDTMTLAPPFAPATYDWLLSVAHATVCTALAATIAGLLLAKLRVRSPRVHRVAWLLVIAQGWLLFPWTLDIEFVSEQAAAPLVVDTANVEAGVVSYYESIAQPAAMPDIAQPWSPTTWLVACWGIGAVLIIATNARRYWAVVRRLPLGEEPARDDWRDEWRRSARTLAVKQPVRFRITERLGPLLCYLPFAYYVLIPRSLWSQLDGTQREAILRHELAHLVRGDLWKSLAVRLFALPQWFNPAVWWAVRRFDEGGEWAADDLATGRSPEHEASYARALLHVAEFSTTYSHTPHAGAVGARGGVISRRIKRLITPRFKEEPVMKKWIVLAVLVGIGVVQLVRVQFVTEEAPPASPTAWVPAAVQEEVAVNDEGAVAVLPVPPRPFPEYRVAPPDVLLVRVVSGLVREGAALRPGDVVIAKIREAESDAQFMVVRGTGTITATQIEILLEVDDEGRLGEHGDAQLCQPFLAEGLTLQHCEAKIIAGLSDSFDIESPRVTLKLVRERSLDVQALVQPDGTIDLGQYGSVNLSGMTLPDARQVVEEQLAKHFDAPRVSVDSFVNNHSVYYVITEAPDQTGTVHRFPTTGNETVLDAIAQVQGLGALSSRRIWIARPAPDALGNDRILPVDWRAISQGGSTETNYQLWPGDRLFIETAGADASRPVSKNTVPPEAFDSPATTYRSPTGEITEHPLPETPYIPVPADASPLNSETCWVFIKGGARWGDAMCDFVTTGNETVLDSLARVCANIDGLSAWPIERAWIARPVHDGKGTYVELPIDWEAINGDGSSATNHRILPGDRLNIVRSGSSAPGYTVSFPVPPAPVHELPVEGVPTDDSDTTQVLVDLKIIRDLHGKLAKSDPFDERLSICDLDEVEATLAAHSGYQGVDLLSRPKLVTKLDQPAKVMVGQEVPTNSDEKPDRIEVDVTARQTRVHSAPGVGPGVIRTVLDIHTAVTDQGQTFQLESEFGYEAGKTAVMRLDHAPNQEDGDETGAVYIVITPKLIERR